MSLGDEAGGAAFKDKTLNSISAGGEGISEGAGVSWQCLSAELSSIFQTLQGNYFLFTLCLSYFSFIACTNINCFG